jgi:hypothetical protein
MKYAILYRSGYILEIRDTEPTEEDLAPEYLTFEEISDEDAVTFESSSESMHYINGSLMDEKSYRDYIEVRALNEKIDKDFPEDLEGAKKVSRKYFANKRYQFEVGGIDVGGLEVRTDRLTVSRIYQADHLASADPTFATEWKLGDGSFITVDATLIGQLSASITSHIQNSFSRERIANQGVDAATTIEELKAVEW